MFNPHGHQPASSLTETITCSNQANLELPSHGALCCHSSPIISILIHWRGVLHIASWQDRITSKDFAMNSTFCSNHKHLLFKHEQILSHLLSQPVLHIKEESSCHHISPESKPPTSNELPSLK